MTTIYALTGWKSSIDGGARTYVRHYFTTEPAARAALPDLVLNGELCTPVKVEPIEVHGPDLDAPLRSPWALDVDAERERRRRAVEQAAADLVDKLRDPDPDAYVVSTVPLRDAVDALRGRPPAEIIAAASGLEPLPAATASVRDELHGLAPLPWRVATASVRDELHGLAPLPWRVANEAHEREVATADGVLLFTVSGPGSYRDDERIAELLVQLVNGPEAVDVDRAQHERGRLVEVVLDAARSLARAREHHGPSYIESGDVVRAVRELDALVEHDKGGGAA